MSNLKAYLNDFEDNDNLSAFDRRARRQRKPRANPRDRQSRQAVAASAAEATALEAGFTTTYQPSRYEEGWLLQSLEPFYERALIADVLAVVKGGKEANVYRCAGHPDAGLDLVAAKVYRPRMFRNLRKDHVYREGRTVLTPEGRPIGLKGDRLVHAIEKKSAYGMRAAHTSWLMHEFRTLEKLHAVGAAVPEPFAANENAILMAYVGDEQSPAPTLHEVTLAPEEVAPLFDEILRNIDLLLQQDVMHGDLSAFNLLYWAGEITIIDFPQVVDPRGNRQAYDILTRDVTRVCEHFAGYGLARDPAAIAERLWRRYVGQTPAERAADEARFLPDEDDAGDEG